MSKGSMQRGNSEYNSWAGGGDLLCPTHVLIFYCFVCILQRYFELSETFRLPPQQCSLVAFVMQGFITRTSKIGSLRPVKLPEPKEENMSMDHAFLNPPRNMST